VPAQCSLLKTVMDQHLLLLERLLHHLDLLLDLLRSWRRRELLQCPEQ
jgi:hypothetical protein